jgi:hypothetical protein
MDGGMVPYKCIEVQLMKLIEVSALIQLGRVEYEYTMHELLIRHEYW